MTLRPLATEVTTPTIDALATGGLKIDGFYTYKVCAPARASFLTGRFPFHLAATKTNFAYFWVLEGTNLNYTMFPEKLQAAGYKTHMVGKWHQGFYAPQYLPTSRGFDSYLGFLSGCEDHLNQLNCCGPCNQTKYRVVLLLAVTTASHRSFYRVLLNCETAVAESCAVLQHIFK